MPMTSTHVPRLVAGIQAAGLGTVSYAVLAQRLNTQGFTTHRGQPWTADRLRAFVYAHQVRPTARTPGEMP